MNLVMNLNCLYRILRFQLRNTLYAMSSYSISLLRHPRFLIIHPVFPTLHSNALTPSSPLLSNPLNQ